MKKNDGNSEKLRIEWETAKAFIKLYNDKTSFKIIEHSDSPDIHCEDYDGNKLNIEISLTEDREGDIQTALGRSDSRNLQAFKNHMESVRAGKASVFE